MPLYVIPKRFQLRGDTAAVLAARNEVLMEREFCEETDTGRFKLGDGSTRWNDLPYAGYGNADLTNLADGNVMAYSSATGLFQPTAVGGVSFSYTTETGSTADSDPGSGLMKWNNATQSSATFLYFDDNTADTGTDLSTFFATLATNSSTGIISMRDGNGAFQVYKWTAITDGTGYFKFAVTHQVSSGSFADNGLIRVVFHPMPTTGSAGSLVLMGTATVVGSAATSLSLSGLDLSADGRYMIQFSFANATASSAVLRLFYNSDTTTTNYYTLGLLFSNGSVAGSSANAASIAGMIASTWVDGLLYIWKGQDSKTICTGKTARDARSTALKAQDWFHIWNNTSNVTSLQFNSDVASSIAVGSYFKVWKVVG